MSSALSSASLASKTGGQTVRSKGSASNAPLVPPQTPALCDDEEDEDAEEYLDVESSTDEDDDAGSLIDFIAEDDDGEEDDDDDASSAVSEAPATKEEAILRDLDGIDASNIVCGKRTRRATAFYDQQVFSSAEYRKMMLCDVPKEEMHAVEESSSGEEGDDEDEDDASFVMSGIDGEEDEDEEDEEDYKPPSSASSTLEPSPKERSLATPGAALPKNKSRRKQGTN